MENDKKKYNPGFKVPSSYFEDLDDKLFSIAAKEKLPKDSGFKVPKDYFKSLEDTIIAKTIEDKGTKVVSIFSRKNIWYASGIAAGLLLLIFINLNKPTTDPSNWELAEIETYISNNLDIETQDIASLLNDEELETLQIESLDISEEALENYLLESLDDTSLLIE